MAEKSKKSIVQVSRHTLIRWSMFGLFIFLMTAFLPKFQGESLKYEVGKHWPSSDLRADFDFPIYKTSRSLEDEKRTAKEKVKPVFVRDTSAERRSQKRVYVAMLQLERDLQQHEIAMQNWTEEGTPGTGFYSKYHVEANSILADYESAGDYLRVFYLIKEKLIQKIYKTGYLDQDVLEITSDIVSLREGASLTYYTETAILFSKENLLKYVNYELPDLTEYDRGLLNELVLGNLEPNYLFSDTLTRFEEKRVTDAILPVYGKVLEGDLIVQRGELVTLQTDAVLKSYIRSRSEKMGQPDYLNIYAGQALMVLMISLLMGLFIRVNRPNIYFRNRRMALVLLLMLVVMGMVGLILRLAAVSLDEFEVSFIYLVPICMVPIMLTAFFDVQMGFFGNIIIALLAGMVVPRGFEFFFIQLCAGSVAVYSLTKLRNRGEFFLTLSLILGVYVVVYLGYGFFSKGNLSTIQYGNLVLFVLNVLLTFIAYPVIYIFERVFKITSDLTYVELLDTNHPLLKELGLRAPGTFQHSLQVANISEAVVNRIGGNSLQARVGGLFHDIGKMNAPNFFVENQKDGVNPHDELDYKKSSLIIVKHVTDGVRLALEYNLPPEIIDFIRTHHGNSKTEYFYRKYKEENPEEEVNPEDFSYSGPLPFSRETAVIMIVDSIEAAARSMKSHSPSELEALVENIVDSKIRNRQFENSSLTFRDLVDIKSVILDNLRSIYHERIEYPEEVKDHMEDKKRS